MPFKTPVDDRARANPRYERGTVGVWYNMVLLNAGRYTDVSGWLALCLPSPVYIAPELSETLITRLPSATYVTLIVVGMVGVFASTGPESPGR